MSENLGRAILEISTEDSGFTKGIDKAKSEAESFVGVLNKLADKIDHLSSLGKFSFSGIEQANSSLKGLETTVKATGDVLTKYKYETTAAAEATKLMAQSKVALAQSSAELKNQLLAEKAALSNEQTQAAAQQKLALAQATSELKNRLLEEKAATQQLSSLQKMDEYAKTAQQKRDLAAQTNDLKMRLMEEKSAGEQSSSVMNKLGDAASKGVHALGSLASAAGHAAGTLAHLGTEAAGAAVKGLEGLVSAAGRAVVGLGKLAAVGSGAFVGLAGVGVKSAGDLEEAVNNISSIKPDIDTKAVFKSLNDLSTKVPQTASQLGDGLYNIFSSIDVTQEEGLKLLTNFSKGAVGAQTDAETFGTSIMGVLNAYKLSVGDADHVQDVFFNTVKNGVVTGSELATSLGPVTSSAKAAGVEFDELGALIAGVTKEGGPASQNINNLNNFLQKVTTKEAQSQLSALGVKTVDNNGKFRSTIDVLGDLKSKLGQMTEAQKANALQAIFPDAQARIGAQTLISQLDNVKGFLDENVKSSGAAEAAFQKMVSGFKAQAQILGNTFKATLTTVGGELLPVLTPVVKGLSSTLQKAQPQIQAFAKEAAGWTQWLLDNVTTVMAGFKGIKAPDFATPFAKMLYGLGAGLQDAKNAVITFKGALAGNWADAPGIGKLAETAGLLGVRLREAFSGFSAGFKGIVVPNNATGVTAFFDRLGESAKKIWDVVSAFSPLTNAIKIFDGILKGGINGGIQAFQDSITNAGRVLGKDFSEGAAVAGGVLKSLVGTVESAGKGFVSGISGPLKEVSERFNEGGQTGKAFQQLLSELPGLDGGLGQSLGNLAGSTINLLGSLGEVAVQSGLVQTAFKAAQTVTDTFGKAISTLAGGVRGHMSELTNAVKSLSDGFQSGLNLASNIVQFFAEQVSTHMGDIGNIFDTAGQTVKSVMDGLNGAFNAVKPGLSTLISGALEAGKAFMDVLSRGARDAGPVLEALGHVLSFLGDILGNAIPVAVNLALAPFRVFFTTVETGGKAISDLMKGDLVGAFNDVVDGAGKLGDAITGNTHPALSQLGDKVKDTTDKLLAQKGLINDNQGALFGIIPALQGAMNAHTALGGEVARAASAVDQLKQSMQAQSQAMSETGQQMATLDQKIAGMPTNVQNLWQEFKTYTDKMREGGASSDEWGSKADAVKEKLAQLDPKLATTADAWTMASNRNKEATKAYQDNTEAAILNYGKQADLQSQLDKTGESAGKMPAAFQPAVNSILDLGKTFGLVPPAAQKGMDEAKAAVASNNFTAQGSAVGATVGSGIEAGISGKVGAIIRAAVAAVNVAIAAARTAADAHSPSRVAIKKIGQPIAEGMAVGIEQGADKGKEAARKTTLDILQEAEKALSSIAKSVEGGTGVFAKLKDYTAANQDAINLFVNDITNLLIVFEGAASKFDEKGLEAASKFGDAVGKITAPIAGSVAGMQALTKYSAANQDQVNVFANDMTNLMFIFQSAGQKFDEDGLKAATTYADAVGKIVAVIGPGVKAFADLTEYKSIANELVDQFMRDLNNLVTDFVESAGWFDAEGLKAAAGYAEAVGKMVAIIGPGVTGLTALRDYSHIADEQTDQFMKDLNNLITDMVESSGWFEVEGLKAAATFAESAGKMVGILSNGVQGFTALQNYKSVPATVISAFVADITLAVNLASEAAAKMEGDLLKQVSLFGEAVGKIFGGFKSAMELFKGLEEFKSTPSTTIQQFIDEVTFTVGLASQMADMADKDLIAQTARFGEATGKIFSGLKSALELFKSLQDYKGYPSAAVNNLIEGVTDATVKMADAAKKSETFMDLAFKFRDNFTNAADAIRQGAGALIDAADAAKKAGATGGEKLPGMASGGTVSKSGLFQVGEKGPELAFLPNGTQVLNASLTKKVLGSAKTTLATPQSVLDLLNVNALGLLQEVEKALSSIAKAVQSGTGVFDQLERYAGASLNNVNAFLNDVANLIAITENQVARFDAKGLEAAAQFGEATGKVFDGFKSSVEIFQKLEDYKATPVAAIQGFIGQINEAVSLVAVLVQNIDASLIAQVSSFGETITNIFSGLNSATTFFNSLKDFTGYPADVLDKLVSSIVDATGLMSTAADISGDFLLKALDFRDHFVAGAEAIQKGVLAMGSVANAADKVAGKSIAADGTRLPGLATGGWVAQGGLFMVGEKGPELAMLPQGTAVFNNSQTTQILQASGNVATGARPNNPVLPQLKYSDLQGGNSQPVVVEQLSLNFPNVQNPLNPTQMRQVAEITRKEIAKEGPKAQTKQAIGGVSKI